MKIIDNPDFFSVQRHWFSTQISKGFESDCWLDFKSGKLPLMTLSDRALKQGEWDEIDLFELRNFLNDTGLKKLNNAISSHKRKIRVTDGKKQTQVYLEPAALEKLQSFCRRQDLTQSQALEIMISKFEDQLDLDL